MLLGPTDEQRATARTNQDLARAEQLYQQSCELCLSIGDDYRVASVRFQLALLRRVVGDFRGALQLFLEALLPFETAVPTDVAARTKCSVCHYYIGQAYLETGNLRAAQSHLKRALLLDQFANDGRRTAAAEELLRRCAGFDEADADPPNPVEHTRAPRVTPNILESLERPTPSALVWVVGIDPTTVARVREQMSEALEDVPFEPRVLSSALSEAPWRTDQVLGGEVSAVVLVLDVTQLQNRSLRAVLGHCVERAASREDFRLYVTLGGGTVEDLKELSKTDGLVGRLIDAVQIGVADNMLDTGQQLRAFVTRLQGIRRLARWTELRMATGRMLGRLATTVQVAAMLGAAAVAIPAIVLPLESWLPPVQDGDPLGWLKQVPAYVRISGFADGVGLACGLASAPFLFAAFDGSLVGIRLALLPPILLTAGAISGSSREALLLGAVLGLLVDLLRRTGLRNQRERRALDVGAVIQKHRRLPAPLRPHRTSHWSDPLRRPLLPVRMPRVFISYSRSSEWANLVANQLAGELRAVGVDAFLDQTDIPLGASWRRFLNRYLARSTTFILLADSVTVQREWPAAELEAALWGVELTRLPRVIVIKAHDLPAEAEEGWSWLPVFREVLVDKATAWRSSVETVSYSPALLKAIAHGHHPDAFASAALIPGPIADPVRRVGFLGYGALMVLGGAAPIALLLPVVLATELWNGGQLGQWLGKRDLLALCVLLITFFAVHAARLAVASRFQLRHVDPISVSSTHAGLSTLMAALALLWLVRLEPLWIGWVAVAGACSWAATDYFIERQARHHPDFMMEGEFLRGA